MTPSTDWLTRAKCHGKDPEMFFPLSERGASRETIKTAKRICWTCSVRQQCLDYAITTGMRDGIWGGLTPTARARMARVRGAA